MWHTHRNCRGEPLKKNIVHEFDTGKRHEAFQNGMGTPMATIVILFVAILQLKERLPWAQNKTNCTYDRYEYCCSSPLFSQHVEVLELKL